MPSGESIGVLVDAHLLNWKKDKAELAQPASIAMKSSVAVVARGGWHGLGQGPSR